MPVDKSADRIRRMFGAIARRYDLMNHLLSLGIDRAWRRKTVRRVSPRGNDPILDLCTGTGDLALAYWRKTAGRVPIVGADFCGPMLTIARQKAQRAGATAAVSFVEADATQLPLADNTFQIVCVAFGLRNVQDTDRGLAEMVRVCRPGGQVAILEFSTPSFGPMRMLYGWYFRWVVPGVGQALARNSESAYNYLPASVGEFPQGPVMCRRLEAAGLDAVRSYPFTFGVATLYVGTK
jgi:demethylmenaquinone methyltransferase/2-methoxy-6-polyprenyl-1,4-benzoquinol methylase